MRDGLIIISNVIWIAQSDFGLASQSSVVMVVAKAWFLSDRKYDRRIMRFRYVWLTAKLLV